MSTVTLTTTPTILDAGTAYDLSLVNSGSLSIHVEISGGSLGLLYHEILRPKQQVTVYPHGYPVSAFTDSGTSSVDVTLGDNPQLNATREATQDALAAGALVKTANLSDLANAGTARSNLGLGTAATHPDTDFLTPSAASATYVASADGKSLTWQGNPVLLVGKALYGANPEVWKRSPAVGVELWALANFQVGAGFNSSTVTPSLTANSTNLSSRTRIYLGNLANHDTPFRLSFDISAMPATGGGWWSVSALLTDAGGTALSGTAEQYFATSGDTGLTATRRCLFEFTPAAGVTGDVYLEVKLLTYNNLASGTLTLSNVSLREIAFATRPIMFARLPDYGGPCVVTSLPDPVSGTYRLAITLLYTDGALTNALGLIDGTATDQPFQYPLPDPAFVKSGGGPLTATNGGTLPSWNVRSIRANNNDQIVQVLKQDGTTLELRGNTHGGETNTTPAVFETDEDGTGAAWTTWDGLGAHLRGCSRFRFTFPTTLTRSAPDNDVFATTSHVATFFPQGVMRMDRTTTFTQAVSLGAQFEWMSSHNPTVPKIGRIGRGLTVIDEADTFVKAAVPATPTAATSTTGGTLAAATYTYAVTALTEGGETTASATVSQATTGTTSTVTVSFASVSGATGYRVYGRTDGRLVLLTTLGPAATSFVDDGSKPAFGPAAPIVNTARLYGTASLATDAAVSGSAYWSVWYDPIVGIAYAQIYDRDTVNARAGVLTTKTRLEGVTGSIQKSYLNAIWATSLLSVANGTAWTATHWAYTYVPQDRANYHLEAALLATDLGALKTTFPAS